MIITRHITNVVETGDITASTNFEKSKSDLGVPEGGTIVALHVFMEINTAPSSAYTLNVRPRYKDGSGSVVSSGSSIGTISTGTATGTLSEIYPDSGVSARLAPIAPEGVLFRFTAGSGTLNATLHATVMAEVPG